MGETLRTEPRPTGTTAGAAARCRSRVRAGGGVRREVVRELEIRNRLGLHARAAAAFVKVAGRYRAEVTVELDDAAVDGTSFPGLLTLGASQGKRIRLRARGGMAEGMVAPLAALVEERFAEGQ